MKVLVFGGSIRSKGSHEKTVVELSKAEGDVHAFIEQAKELVGDNELANSELLCAAAMKGVLDQGAEVEYLPLIDLFERKESPLFEQWKDEDIDPEAYLDTLSITDSSLAVLKEKLDWADGVVLATPVYFGDRSSVANKLLQVGARYGLLKDKVFGVTSVGAKRNGGQETCNIYSITEALNQGSLAVGNGPPTSQYGGTAVAGDKNRVLDDPWGLMSTFGVGTKVAHVASMFHAGNEAPADTPVTVDIVVTSDTPDLFLANYLRELTGRIQAKAPWATFRILEAIHNTVYRCIGCDKCPAREDENGRPTCRLTDPEQFVEKFRDSAAEADSIIIAGLNPLEAQNLIFRYQVLTERMRYIRRHNFELTDKLFAGLCYQQFGATVNPIHSTKTLTSYIRHNTTFHKPIEILEHQGQMLEDGMEPLLNLVRAAQRLKTGKGVVPPPNTKYETGGIAGGYKKA